MKKFLFGLIATLSIVVCSLVPVAVYGEEDFNGYDEFPYRGFKFSIQNSSIDDDVSYANVVINSAIDKDALFYFDRTDEFIFDEYALYECKNSSCTKTELVYNYLVEEDEDYELHVFEKDKKYVMKLSFYPFDDSSISLENADAVSYKNKKMSETGSKYSIDGNKVNAELMLDYTDEFPILVVVLTSIGGAIVLVAAWLFVKNSKKNEKKH